MVDASQSPAFALLTGTNYIVRSVSDAIFATNGFGKLTVALVVDPRTVWSAGQTGVVLSKFRSSNNQRQFKIEYDQSTNRFTVSLWDDPTAASPLCSRQWSTPVVSRVVLCFVYDGAGPTLDCYADGALDNGTLTGTVPATIANGTEPIAVGVENSTGTPVNLWRGSLHMLAVWNIALTSVEVATIGYAGLIPAPLKVIGYAPQILCEHTGVVQQTLSNLISQFTDTSTFARHFTGAAASGAVPFAQQDSGGRLLVANDWGDSLNDLGFLVQGLTSTYTSAPPFALWGVSLTPPQRPNYRADKHDFTLFLRARRVAGTVESIFIQIYGVQLRYVLASKEMYADVGDDPGSNNKKISFGINLFAVEGVTADLVIRYNAKESELDFFIGTTKYAKSQTLTAAKYIGTTLILAANSDFSRSLMIPQCISDAQVLQLQALIQQQVFSFGPETFPFNTFGKVEQPYYAPEQVDQPAPPAPFGLEAVPQQFSEFKTPVLPTSGGTFDPYGVIDLPTRVFDNPNPVAVSVTVDGLYVVTATVLAGATNADPTISWWEVELTVGGPVVVSTLLVLGSFFFSGRNNDVRNFAIPVGQNWNGLRVRAIIRAASDVSQVWYSNYLTMTGPAFDNSGGAFNAPLYSIPTPVINTVSIDPGTHQMTMQGTIGPITSDLLPFPPVDVWWEVEIRPGEYVGIIDVHHRTSTPLSIGINDTFFLPLGTNFRGKPIRLVVAARYDYNQRVQSAQFVMTDDAYDYNLFTPQPLPPGPGHGPAEPPTVGLPGTGVRSKRTLDFTTRR